MAAKVLTATLTGWAGAAGLKAAFDAWAVAGQVVIFTNTDWVNHEVNHLLLCVKFYAVLLLVPTLQH